MVKTYLKYQLSNVVGQVSGKVEPVVHFSQKFFFTAINDYIVVFSVKTGKAIQYIKSDKAKTEITCLEVSDNYLFVGYNNGTILQFKINQKEIESTNYSSKKDAQILEYESKFSLHRAAITCLEYNPKENQLLSASKDTTIYLWDIVSETVLYKYTGHKDSIIKACFYDLVSDDDKTTYLKLIITCSKDNTIKFWNRTTQECVQTIANLVNKINYFTIFQEMLVLGTYDNKLSIYKLAYSAKKQKVDLTGSLQLAHLKGSLLRKTGAKIISMKILFQERLLVVFSNDKIIEFFKILSDKEIETRVFLNESKKSLAKKAEIPKNKNNTSNNNENNVEDVNVIKERVNKLIENEDYNYSFRFFNLIKFFDENDTNNVFFIEAKSTSSMMTKKQNKENNINNINTTQTKLKMCLATNDNIVDIYDMDVPCLVENLFKINKKSIISKINSIADNDAENSNKYFIKDLNRELSNFGNPLINEDNFKIKNLYSLDIGHKEPIKYVKFSTSNTKFLSVSSDCVRVWKYNNTISYITDGYVNFDNTDTKVLSPQYSIKKIIINKESPISAIFMKGDEFIVIGTKQGNIHLVDSDSCVILASLKAHEGEVTTMFSLKVEQEFYVITSSNDKKINYFSLQLDTDVIEDYMNNSTNNSLNKSTNNTKKSKMIIDDINENNQEEDEFEGEDEEEELNDNGLISFANSLNTTDQITCLSVTPNKKYLCYSLLDNSIRVVYSDSGKQFLNLYGHKLPVLSFDVSSDSTLMISGSSDKNVRIWGMDFGDCHKALFAHHDSVTCVKFVNKTHYFFTGSKDGVFKYWDADAFCLITEYKEFYGEIWSLDINLQGTTVLIGSSDKTIKLFELTKEQMVIETENEKRLDEQMEDDLMKDLNMPNTVTNPLNKNISGLVPIKKNLENLTISEELIEGLDMCENYKEDIYQYELALEDFEASKQVLKSKSRDINIKFLNIEQPEKPTPPMLLLGKNIFDYILFKLKRITPLSELENSLNNLPYSYVQKLLFYIEYFIRNRVEVELFVRCFLFLLRLYESQFSNDKTIMRILESIGINMRVALEEIKDTANYNFYSMETLERIYKNKLEEIREINEDVGFSL